jgi:uncharacterized phage protein (TIGR02220 family)
MINIDERLLPNVTADELWLLIHITKRLGADFTCFPSNATLLKDTGWKDERTLNKIKSALKAKGLIEQTIRVQPHGGQTSNLTAVKTEYISVMVTAAKLSENANYGGAKNGGGGGAKNAGEGGAKNGGGGGAKNAGEGGAKNAPLSIIQLSIEQLSIEQTKYNPPPPIGGDDSPDIKTDTDVTEILEFLNAYSGRKLPVTGDRATASRQKVKNLYKRKYKQSEIKEVIQCKCFEWKHDPNMVQYLHPTTLFLPSNFQKYLDLVNDLKSNPEKAKLFKNKVNKVKNGNNNISDEFKQALTAILD